MLGSAQGQRTMHYMPGARVQEEEEPPKKRRKTPPRQAKGAFPGCCTDVLERILKIMVQRHEGLSVIKLSMVNKWFHQEISQNVEVWRELYTHWRGPLTKPTRLDINGNPLARLRPSIPRSLPNFRDKPPRIS